MIGGRTIEQTLHVAPVISSKMEKSIELWGQMYKGEAPWLHEPTFADPSRVVSLGLPALIASEKARTALLEFQSEITTPVEEVEIENPDYVPPAVDELGTMVPAKGTPTTTHSNPISDTQRAEYLNSQYKKLKKQLRRQIEYGIAKGGLIIKPYVVPNTAEDEETTYDTEFDFIQADSFYPLAYDAAGKITEAAFIQTKIEKDTIYRRLEYHKWHDNTVDIINKAFKSVDSPNTPNLDTAVLDLGKEIPLTDVPEWSGMQAKTTVKNVKKPLFAYFKMPEANTIDLSSPLGVSGFSRAVSLIKDADMQYSRLLWEYEGGQLAIDVDRDALNFKDDGTDQTGRSGLSNLQNRLYRSVDLGESNTFQPYNPTLRDTSFIAGLNTILMRIEDETGMSRGTISDTTAEARTATELKILKQRSYQTNADIQAAIQDALEDVIYVMNVYADLYQITAPGEYEVSYEWDDSILVDVDQELGKRITLMQNGLASKVEVRQWYFGETEQQAREALVKVSEEGQEAMEQNIIAQQNAAQARDREE